MLEELRKLMRAAPFRPFTLHMADGRAFRIPHPEHIMLMTNGVIIVEDDEGLAEFLSPSLLASIATQTAEA